MNSKLWRRIKRYVVTGQEAPKVDLKQTLDLSGKSNQAEFAKDITAIANTPGGDGFIIIGVRDIRDRTNDTLQSAISGFQAEAGADAFRIRMLNALTQFCNRIPTIEYDEIAPPGLDLKIGVIKIGRSTKRPHSFIRGSGDLEQNDIFIRRGTATFSASVDEIEDMMGKTKALPPYIVINLSGHPLTNAQREEISREMYIEELIELPAHFDTRTSVKAQIKGILDQIGLTLAEWQNHSILLALPGLAPAAAVLLAYIHGLRGGFPRILWLERIPDTSQFTVANLVDLQGIRDQAREIRVIGDIE